ncbi:nucleoside deaminase [Xenorhabdus sp. 12]|uniref:Nucleoside deaminase n=2 Tax=Xenorhabdus santafensis TaxID=2582833 RepID=A0ABU4S3X4_9GAMM|nr:nucleoside deaminase [Xenorhabdus sp. 12]
MKDVVTFSSEHVHDGGIPFAAFVVDATGKVFGRGVNQVRENHDPAAHAEVEAIRDACRSLRTPYLHGTTLLASGEPCAMCYMNALYAGVSQVLFAVDRDEAAAHGFDYRHSYRLFASDPLDWQSLVVRKFPVPNGLHPFLQFSCQSSKC